MFHLQKHIHYVAMVIFGNTCQTWERHTLLSLRYSYTNTQQDTVCPNTWAAWTTAAEKSHHVRFIFVKSYGAHESLSAVHQSIDTKYFQTEPFETANG
jgi:hypothetical protein